MFVFNFKTLWRLIGVFIVVSGFQIFYEKFGIALAFMLAIGILSLLFFQKLLIPIIILSTCVYFSRGFSFIPELLINSVLLIPITILSFSYLQTILSKIRKKSFKKS
ncbi:hypothetical protein DIX60_01865 [Streptococcus iniae]|nr:hypothetical protein DIX60_01865 [Streptococcus iniae]